MEKNKLLFVDDEENVIKSLTRLFQDEGYDIYTAPDGIKGIKLIDEHEFSLILSDYRMPEMDGVEFLKLAKAKSPDTVRMILTGFADVDVAISAINEGEVYKFAEKPWKNENLKVQVKRAVEYYELIKERKELLEKIKRQNEKLKEWNINLEKKVEEKTKELKKAYSELQLRNKELKGRDKILQFLLEIHPLEESMEVVLTEIMDIVPVNKLAVYVFDQGTKTLKPQFGMIQKGKKRETLSSKDLQLLPALPKPTFQEMDEKYYKGFSEANKIGDYSAFIPLEKQHDVVGLLLLDNTETRTPLNDFDLKTAADFASLTAIVINDYLVMSSSTNLENTIQDILQRL